MAVVLFSTVATGAQLVTGQIFNLCASEPGYIIFRKSVDLYQLASLEAS